MKKKFIDIKNITSQEKLILAISILILIVIATSVIRVIFDSSKNINYKKQTIEDIYDEGQIIEDRNVYWPLNNIIAAFIGSYQSEIANVNNIQSSYTREDFYNTLSDEYKKVLSKRKYLEKSKEMFDKFIINNTTVKQNDYIEQIRMLDSKKYSNDMYIVKLKTVAENSSSYIGIRLIPNIKKYSIFYLE